MPRTARKKSKTGIYHIILRGINRQSIFENDEDKERLLETLIRYKEKCQYKIYAYCFMDNHFHLLLKEDKEPLEQIMRRIGGSYVYWYNKKYERIGHLFQDRFKSEPVETDSYFLTVIRYIHQNPLKAGITRNIEEYKWSSSREYLRTPKIVDKNDVLKIFDKDAVKALELFIKFHNKFNDDKCLDIKEKKKRISDDELRQIIKNKFNIEAWTLHKESKEKRKIMLKKLLKIEGVSTRQLARVTGVSTNIIWKL
ncbi:transposase [Maledivibacter halophilus]|uniref:REP element-mobilizing transposase RayT n=1 Tax=Maledivibacter halophilus TaxID=36842 RepID=A0A1T5JWR2_9FIRM|nr:transposase [Maledivibacter halophilus]SKC55845.1 REP element-mobilizing transposase RayT [Maledivibacter halophilus]